MQTVICPNCDAPLEAELQTQAVQTDCPVCGRLILIPAIDGSTHLPNNDAPDDQLSERRIRQIAAARKAVYRSRSYLLIGSAFCLVAGMQLLWFAVLNFAAQRLIGGALLAVGGAGLLAASVYFLITARQLKREAETTALPLSPTSPDLSKLGDGTQQVRNLEDLTRGE